MRNVMEKMKFLLSSAEIFSLGSLKHIKSVDLEWSGVGALWDTCGILKNASEFTRVFNCRTLLVGAYFEELFTSEERLCAWAESSVLQSLV